MTERTMTNENNDNNTTQEVAARAYNQKSVPTRLTNVRGGERY